MSDTGKDYRDNTVVMGSNKEATPTDVAAPAAGFDFDTPVDRSGTYSLKWEEAGDALPMWVADMDFATAPAIRDALRRRVGNGVFGYSIIPEDWNLSYTRWWKARHGLDIDPESLIFATGVIPAISSMVRKLTTPAENVLIMTPVYNIFFNSILNNGRNALQCPLAYRRGDDGKGVYEINWDDFECKLADPQTTLMILCNPHNPTGMIWTRETLARIGELCRKYHVTVISDEIHCDLTDPGSSYVPFAAASASCAAVSVTCLAPTKAFNIAGIHTAAVMVPDATLRHKVWRGLNTDEVAEPNSFAIDAAIAAFTQGSSWLDALRVYIAGNKREAARIIDEYNASVKSGSRVALVAGPATYLLWLDCSAFVRGNGGVDGGSAAACDTADLCDAQSGFADTDGLCDWLRREHHVMFSPGSQFGGNGGRFLRINVACQRDFVKKGLRRLVAGLNQLGA